MNIKNLKIGQKLGLSFGIIVSLLLLMSIIAYLCVDELNNDLDLTNKDRYPKTVQAHIIKDELNETARNMSNILLMTDAETLKAEYANMDQSAIDITKAVEALDKTITSKRAREDLDALQAARKEFLAVRTKFVQVSREGNKEEALSLLLKEVRPVQIKYFDALDKLIGYQASLMDQSSKEAEVSAAQTEMLIVGLTIAAIIISGLLAFITTRLITRPMKQAVELANKVAGGDLSSDIQVTSTDETGQLLLALKGMNDSLARIVGEVRAGTDTIATASSQIAAGNMDLSSRTEEQAGSLEETASSMEELTSTVKQNADNARQANQLAVSASDVAQKGGDVVAQVVQTMVSINDSSKKIVDIIGVIDGIAFQTNILALNAAVEAARAGEQGRGFAVVASEVRNLAQRSAAAAKEIKTLISDSVEKVGAGTRLVDQAGATMDEVVQSVRRVTDVIAEISAASNEQSTGIEQINQAITQMDEVTQQNASLVEESAAAAESMQHQASNLSQLVAGFKLGAESVQANLSTVMETARQAIKPATVQPQIKTVRHNAPNAMNIKRLASAVKVQPKRQFASASASTGEWVEF
ncbi:methyl-accepting chemotaxis protein [Undibacterium sp. KW1]|uniref:methyl-accepting chemotaxis protein n=1 Tax=Undibacterium sp. KW1 TaxID=2058624 RepID=UPI001331DB45|nr:methyl-accepting chemotaxis protein [Undibacterium sp. KW1]BBB62007.1 methyl-accepting chemotaxis protein [Undibacterium sp. KW1]